MPVGLVFGAIFTIAFELPYTEFDKSWPKTLHLSVLPSLANFLSYNFKELELLPRHKGTILGQKCGDINRIQKEKWAPTVGYI